MVFAIAFPPLLAKAYEIQTHATLSEAAFDRSVLNDSQLLSNLGVGEAERFLNSKDPDQRSVKELVSDGARFEDDVPRPLNHFFDPLTGNAYKKR